MNQKIFLSVLLGMGIALGINAQDATAPAAETPVAAEATVVAPAQTVSDGGVEVVYEAQATPQPVAKKEAKDAKQALNNYIKSKKWKSGWDAKKKRYIAVEHAEFDCADPANSADFLVLRDAATRRAILQAKAKIIEFCNTKMDAMDMVHTPGTDLNKAMGAEANAIEANLVAEKEKLANLLAQFNKAEAEQLRSSTFSDNLTEMMDNVLKKITSDDGKTNQDPKVLEKIEAIKAEFETQKSKVAELEKKAKARKGSLARSQTSAVATMASMPLYGATAVAQTESFDGKRYQVAIAMVWSVSLERAARAAVTGEDFKLKAKENGMSIEEWLEKQPLASMVGPRQFLDKDGRRWFIGICARDYNDDLNDVVRERNKDLAENFAKSVTAFSIMGDVESYKAARQEVRTYMNGNDTDSSAVEAIEKKLTQTITGKTVRGLQEISGEEVEHPISGKTIYVSVYAIEPTSVQAALKMEVMNYATKVQQEIHESEERGRDAANAAAVKSATGRSSDVQKGANDQVKKIGGEIQKRQPVQGTTQPQQKVNQVKQTPAQPKAPAKSSKGVFVGGTDEVDDDF